MTFHISDYVEMLLDSEGYIPYKPMSCPILILMDGQQRDASFSISSLSFRLMTLQTSHMIPEDPFPSPCCDRYIQHGPRNS